MKKRFRILISMLWAANGFFGVANVLRLFYNARRNGGWYGSEGTVILWAIYTLLALVNTVLWAIQYRKGKQQAETVDKPEE